MGDIVLDKDADDLLWNLEGLVDYAKDNYWTSDMILNGICNINKTLKRYHKKKVDGQLTGYCDNHSPIR